MPDAYLILFAAFIASFMCVLRRHRQNARSKKTFLARLDRLAQHHDLFRR
jgi:hypothetical protein